MKKIEKKLMLILLKLWVKYKCWFAKKMRWIHPLHLEQTITAATFGSKIPKMPEIEKSGIPYKQDKLFGLIPWDFQYDIISAVIMHGADCNTVNRIIQICLNINNYKSYLVTYWAQPFRATHTTCVAFEQGIYYSWDYGIKRFSSNSMEICVRKIAESYCAKALCYVVQDENWKIISKGIL